MHEELIIAGFGGQGILFIGKMICLAAMEEKRQVTRFPSYGPTMRGGEANCTIIVSSEAIGSPISEHPDSIIVMNEPSLNFAECLKPGGLMVVNKSLANWNFSRKDIEVLEVKATDIAEELGNLQVANLVMLGVYLKKRKVVGLESAIKALRAEAAAKKLYKPLAELNEKALERGWNEIK